MKSIQSMYQHLKWADEHILLMLKNLPEDHQKARKLYSHILYAEKIWLTRLLKSEGSHIPLWDAMDLEQCEQLAKTNSEHFSNFLSQLKESDLDTLIHYKNSTNKQFNTTIRDILIHIAMHGQYHRGQINILIREAGFEPINIDYITFAREL